MRDLIQELEYTGDVMPAWVAERMTVRVKNTPIMRRYGFGLRGGSAADDRAWPGEVGTIQKRIGNGWWDWTIEFPRGRRAVLYAKDIAKDGDLARYKAAVTHADMGRGNSRSSSSKVFHVALFLRDGRVVEANAEASSAEAAASILTSVAARFLSSSYEAIRRETEDAMARKGATRRLPHVTLNKNSPAPLVSTVDAVKAPPVRSRSGDVRRGHGSPQPVDDPFYVIQGLYKGPEAYLAGGSFGYDDEGTAIREAEKLAGSPFFEGDYVRIITRDGEPVWDSRRHGDMKLGISGRRGARRR
jgi:hypothetical protein